MASHRSPSQCYRMHCLLSGCCWICQRCESMQTSVVMAPYVNPCVNAHGCATTCDPQIRISSCPFGNPVRARGKDQDQDQAAAFVGAFQSPALYVLGQRSRLEHTSGTLDASFEATLGRYLGYLTACQPIRSTQAIRSNINPGLA